MRGFHSVLGAVLAALLAACGAQTAPRTARPPAALASLHEAADRETRRILAAARSGVPEADLRASDAMNALFRVDGALRLDAQTVGALVAADRITLARDLPPREAAVAVEGAFVDLFGVFAPAFGEDDTAVVREGRWLACLATAAAVAGHAVPDSVRDRRKRERLAWSGVLEGVGDRLRGLADALPRDDALRVQALVAADAIARSTRDARRELRCARSREVSCDLR